VKPAVFPDYGLIAIIEAARQYCSITALQAYQATGLTGRASPPL